MPLDFSLGQVTTKNLPWDVDDYLASEYLSNTTGTPGLSDLLQADYSMAYQPSSNTDLNYACHKTSIESVSSETSEPLTPTGQQNQTPTQIFPTNNLSYSTPEVELRSASRKPKNCKRRSAVSGTRAHARECHNLIEKQYRTRLKSQFERLLAVLPASNTRRLADKDSMANSSQVLSRGQVLDLASERILELENEIAFLLSIKPNGYPTA
ncbi:hypothetical protein FOMG_19444 [Fusarium oxysporum f. sp. melonis 26406]|uniref:BHLH domain-containing protein n=1 Tax=Fusarium oxysporum f. sp. melonis 26406 TaxID=1089452 RepID=W9Z597_FUSOX|nr:hypothetical protein FOMG_19444 [Fusarium oxysporum f. sp. melonis 26406]